MTYYRIIDNMDVSGEKLQTLIRQLPAWRREAAERFKFEAGKKECAMSYHLLCSILRQRFDIHEQPKFSLGEHGKPSLVFENTDRKIHFNLSHCKCAVACIVSDDREVGIDVECIGRYKHSLAEYCMNDDEMTSIDNAFDADIEFTRLWTQKEALLKLTGEGITDNMKDVLHSSRMRDLFLETKENEEHGYVCTIAHYGEA